jgi:hypothetical protein
LTELARKNMEVWEQMQAATRKAFGAAADPDDPARRDAGKTSTDRKKGK